MFRRRAVLGGIAALPLVPLARAAEPSLAALAEKTGRYFGSALATDALDGGNAYGRLLSDECDVFVPEWQLKWGALMPDIGSNHDFSSVDRIVEAAQSAGKRLRGHTLLWHEHLPTGIAELSGAKSWDDVVVPHFETVLNHYPDQFFQWDVVNEAIEPRDGQPGSMRDTPFYRMLGEDYVVEAFRLAHALAPQARLYLNDYNVCYDEAWQQDRRSGILRLVERLLEQDVPLHGFGIQGHLDTRFAFDDRVFSQFLETLAGFGLELSVTELDVREADEAAGLDIAQRQQRSADEVQKVLSVALDQPALTGVTTWGLADSASWLRTARDLPDNQGLPYDAQLNPTPMRGALAALFAGAVQHG